MRPLAVSLALIALAGSACTALHAADAEPKTLMTQRGKVLLTDDLRQPLGADWIGKPGKWETVEGALQGSEVKADMHGAVRRRKLAFQNAVIQYDFRLLGARQTSLSINDAGGHVCRVIVRPNGFTVQKDDHDHAGPDKAVQFETKTVKFEPGKWYTLVVEVLGDEMVAQVGDQVGFGGDPMIANPKTNLGFTVSGESAQFRNLRVWEAQPNTSWTETKQRLVSARK
jgi:hypothetical protein